MAKGAIENKHGNTRETISLFFSNAYEHHMENVVMHWHLSNALIWSGFCDVLSGLWAVVPKMRVIYYKLDYRHLMDIDMRAGDLSIRLGKFTSKCSMSKRAILPKV